MVFVWNGKTGKFFKVIRKDMNFLRKRIPLD